MTKVKSIRLAACILFASIASRAGLVDVVIAALNTSDDAALAACFLPEAGVSPEKATDFRHYVQNGFGTLTSTTNEIPSDVVFAGRSIGYDYPGSILRWEVTLHTSRNGNSVLIIEIPENRDKASRVDVAKVKTK